MSSRFDNRSNNSFRSGRSSSRRQGINRSSGSNARPLGNRASREDNPYRSRRGPDELEVYSNSSKDEKINRNRTNTDRRIDGLTKQSSSFSTPSYRKNRQDRFSREEPGNNRISRNERRGRFNQQRNELKALDIDREVYSSSNSKESFSEFTPNDLLWGRHATQAALEAERPIHRIWCTSEVRSTSRFLQLLKEAKSSGVLVEEVSWARLGQLTHGAVHQGIALQIAAAETLDLATLVKGCKELDENPLLIALDGLTDPQNLGAIVRSAEALGAHGLVLPQRRSAGLTGSVAKVAAGALEHLPVARVVNLNRSLEELKKTGYRVIGLAEEGDVTLGESDLSGPLVVVTGSEDKGISLVTRRHCDQLVRIPLRGVTTSLNASVATAVLLYEIARRGWMKGLSGQAPSPRMTRARCSYDSMSNNEAISQKESQ